MLTRYPVRPAISPTEAEAFITNVLQYLEPVPLTIAQYQTAIAQMVVLQIPGGGIFDALIAQAALSVQGDAILTLNPRHFIQLGEEISRLVQVPN